jgi:hypothetical protein
MFPTIIALCPRKFTTFSSLTRRATTRGIFLPVVNCTGGLLRTNDRLREARTGAACQKSPRSKLAGSTGFYGLTRPAVLCRYYLSGYSWSSIALIISVPIGSFSKGMKFLVRIKYSLSTPFGMAASCFNSFRRSSLVFIIAVISTSWIFTRSLVLVEAGADPNGQTSTPSPGLLYTASHS